MAGRSNKVKAGMDTEVNFGLSSRLLLLEHVRLMLVVKELYDRHPGVAIVYVVAEAGSIDHR